MSILGKERQREWETVYATGRRMIEVFSVDPAGGGMTALMTEVVGMIEDHFQRVDAGAPFVWYNLGFEPELVFAFPGVGNVCSAQLAALCSIMGDQADTEAMIDVAEAHGYSAECCSADKAGVGAMVKDLYPHPACMVGINTPCDSQVSMCNAMAERHHDKPIFAIDVPAYIDDRTTHYVARQLRDLIPFLERNTGVKFEWENLKSVCQTSNHTIEALWDWMDSRSQKPTMQPSKLSAFTMALMIMFSGSPRGLRVAQGFAADARDKIKRQVRYFEERVRAVWYQDPVWWDIQLYDWMESELGLTIPIDVFGYYASEGLIDTSSEEGMLHGLADKIINRHPMSRQFRTNMKRYIDDFMTLHQRFQADCGILAGHIACKHAWGGVGLFKEACKKADVPLLVFEFDMFDSRILTYKELQFELRRFVEDVVWPRKQRRAAGG